ncbi:single-stranded DNA-binding protein [Acutalibacter sp. 1XD8-36]|uniref:single-stranded DNA-binding protein n=1 Tax=Acutalibacter sp. 1XD8-36 TaxID=2320852 RepID=UPI001411D9BA|nr:single-stranded DNA-binding protein [Acutalibacter sp. 1XD8-36]NBJ88510.1 single-stranded DNA-binding protein [Acutalibacter sp. 1XD8-36]
MLAVLITGAVISKGFQDEPAIKVSDSGKAVWFRVGKKVYDPQAEDNRRWININVKGFNYMAERIQKMQLKEGVYVNIRGRLDEDVWKDKDGETHKNLYVIAEDIEYAGGKSKDESESYTAPVHQPDKAPLPTEAPGEFTGYEAFGGTSFFDD